MLIVIRKGFSENIAHSIALLSASMSSSGYCTLSGDCTTIVNVSKPRWFPILMWFSQWRDGTTAPILPPHTHTHTPHLRDYVSSRSETEPLVYTLALVQNQRGPAWSHLQYFLYVLSQLNSCDRVAVGDSFCQGVNVQRSVLEGESSSFIKQLVSKFMC